MRLFFLSILLVFAITQSRAQERIGNVRVRVLDSAEVEIRYDLLTARPGDSLFFEVRSRLRGALYVRPEFVRGDIGRRITAGSDRRIVWNALGNGFALHEPIQVIVRVKTGLPLTPDQPLDQQPVTTQMPAPPRPDAINTGDPVVPVVTDTNRVSRRRYDGPAWALLSAVAPGIGNIFVQRPRPRVGFRPLATAVTYSLLAYGLLERQQAQDDYGLYEEQKNAAAGEPFYATANQHHQRYYLATRGAAVIVLTDVVLTFVKGLRNRQLDREARRISPVSVRPGMQAGQLTAVVRYSF